MLFSLCSLVLGTAEELLQCSGRDRREDSGSLLNTRWLDALYSLFTLPRKLMEGVSGHIHVKLTQRYSCLVEMPGCSALLQTPRVSHFVCWTGSETEQHHAEWGRASDCSVSFQESVSGAISGQ